MAEPTQEQASTQPEVSVTQTAEKPAASDVNTEKAGLATDAPHQPNGADPDAQSMLIGSLRNQIQDLFSQVTQLNGKLVQSYDRVSDLEDNLHVASSNVRQSSIKISQLELERTQHLAALNTGLLVEKSHVTAELTRLMEKATEEAAQRGQAESARHDIEKDLDDLSATLFDQANTMVAEARFARAQSERKVEDAERALKGAEEAVGMMQQQMQEMQAEKERSEKSAEEMRVIVGKGKWVERAPTLGTEITSVLRLRSSHLPYQEFLLFVAHLRSMRPNSASPPAMSTLLPQPFLARLLNEDSEPTVRLDLAPSLNWLSRRSVLSAIHAGQLTIEPMSSTHLLQETQNAASLSSPIIPGSTSNGANISCALCGTAIFHADGGSQSHSNVHGRPPPHPFIRTASGANSNSWSASLFKKPLSSYSASATPSANTSPPASPSHASHSLPQQIYIFRLASTALTTNLGGVAMSVGLPSSLSATSTSSSQPPHHPTYNSSHSNQTRTSQSTIYPLCTSGWCLARLRLTCTLWAFVRTGVVEKVWEEEVPSLPPPPTPSRTSLGDKLSPIESLGSNKPPLPPRRRGLWGMASALGERAASWGEGDRSRTPDKEADKQLPPPPGGKAPPPLPKRAEGRRSRSATVSRAVSPALAPPPASVPVVEEESAPAANGHSAEVEPSNADKIDEKPEENNVEKAEDLRSLAPSETIFDEGPDSKPTSPHKNEHTITAPPPSTGDNTEAAPDASSQLPSPIERRNSQDSFASAASEITPSDAPTPSVPASSQEIEIPPAIPPVSASPDTPALNPPATPTQAKANTDPATPPPSVITSDVKQTPSRTGSPAPPPLPRRAAARARPSSFIPPAPPAAATPENPASSNENADVFGTTATVDGETTAKKIVADPIAAINPPNEQIIEDVAETPSIPEAIAKETQEEVGEESAPAHVANGTGDLDNISPLVEKKSIEISSSPVATVNGDHTKTSDADTAVVNTSKSEENTDGEVYIGDATWEERTWKELTKLKEDMFWARVGGIR